MSEPTDRPPTGRGMKLTRQDEEELFRWLEAATMGDVQERSWCFFHSGDYGLIEWDRGEWRYELTTAGREWFEPRMAAIRAACDRGAHEYAAKTPTTVLRHCRWCGVCETSPCAECAAAGGRQAGPVKPAAGGTNPGGRPGARVD